MRRKFSAAVRQFWWKGYLNIVARSNGELAGYAYATLYRPLPEKLFASMLKCAKNIGSVR
jgi:hypothetical protein